MAEGEEFVIERIIAHCDFKMGEKGKKRLYLVKWDSYPLKENTWEPEVNVSEFIKGYTGEEREFNFHEDIVGAIIALDDNDQVVLPPPIPNLKITSIVDKRDRFSYKVNQMVTMYLCKLEYIEELVWLTEEEDGIKKLIDKFEKNRLTGKKRRRSDSKYYENEEEDEGENEKTEKENEFEPKKKKRKVQKKVLDSSERAKRFKPKNAIVLAGFKKITIEGFVGKQKYYIDSEDLLKLNPKKCHKALKFAITALLEDKGEDGKDEIDIEL